MTALALTLLGYPLSILASFSYEKLKAMQEQMDDLVPYERLFVDSFHQAIKIHNKLHDKFSTRYLNKIKKEIKKDESKLLTTLSVNGELSLSPLKREEFRNEVAANIRRLYPLDDHDDNTEVLNRILADCFKCYEAAFFRTMTEKQGIQIIIKECCKLSEILDTLKQVNINSIPRDEFEALRKFALDLHMQNSKDYSKTIQEYDAYIKNKFNYLELRGFSPKISGKEIQMELEDIFVPSAMQGQCQAVPLLSGKEELSGKAFDSTDILNHKAAVILGDPGSGKSTLLKYLAKQIVRERTKDHLLKNIVPVFLRLSDYANYFKQHRTSIHEYITTALDRQYENLFRESFECSNLLLLLDGLDEITETSLRLRIVEQVTDLVARYPNNQYIVTSRIVGYREAKLGGGFEQFKLLPFTDKEICCFAEQWYKSIADHTDRNYPHASQQAKALCASIKRNKSVFRLASNPLLMTIISMIHYQGKKLPSKRIELYEISTETFLEHWVQLRINDEKQLRDKTEIIEILAPIAFFIHENKSDALIEEDEFEQHFVEIYQEIYPSSSFQDAKRIFREFSQFLRQQTGFFYEKGVDDDGNRYFGFMHLTFEEYLASIELVSRWEQGKVVLKDYIYNPRWTEILRLAAAQIRLSFKGGAGRNKASEFIRDILTADDEFKDGCRPLRLASLILSDDVGIKEDLYNEIIEQILQVLAHSESWYLSQSFCSIYADLLSCDNQSHILSKLKDYLQTDNPLLLKNLASILSDHYGDENVKKMLDETENCEELKNNILKQKIGSLDKATLLDYVSKRKKVATGEEYNELLDHLARSKHVFYFNREITPETIRFLQDYQDTEIFDDLCSSFLSALIPRFILDKNEIHKKLIHQINELQSYKYLNNFMECVAQINKHKAPHASRSIINVEQDSGLLTWNKEENTFTIWIWDRTFDKLTQKTFRLSDWDELAARLGYSPKTCKTIKNRLYYMLGPDENDMNLSLQRFITLNEEADFIFAFSPWDEFLIYALKHMWDKESSIIFKAMLQISFLSDTWKEHMDELKKIDLIPPIRLFLYSETSTPYDNTLVKETIDFYNTTGDAALKLGTFDVLYNVLNVDTDN